jgi:hypothetical protein
MHRPCIAPSIVAERASAGLWGMRAYAYGTCCAIKVSLYSRAYYKLRTVIIASAAAGTAFTGSGSLSPPDSAAATSNTANVPTNTSRAGRSRQCPPRG